MSCSTLYQNHNTGTVFAGTPGFVEHMYKCSSSCKEAGFQDALSDNPQPLLQQALSLSYNSAVDRQAFEQGRTK